MKNLKLFPPASIALAVMLAAGLTGCQLFKKDEPKTDEKPTAETAAGETAVSAVPTEPPTAQPSDSKPASPAAESATPPPPPAEAPDMGEFAGLPKGEAEFILECRRLGESADPVIAGRDGLTFSRDELRELGANRTANSSRHRNIVASLAAYAARIKASGAEFAVLPVPPKAVIYPDRLPHEPALKDKRYDSYLESLYAELRRNGVKVIDVTDDLHDDRFDKRGAAFPKGDPHWSPRAAQSAAELVHKELKRAAPFKSLARDKTITEKTTSVDAAGESMRVRSVGVKSGDAIEPVPPAPDRAAIVLVGDANALVYHQAGSPTRFDGRSPAGFADQLAFEFGAPVEVRAQPGLNWKRAPDQFRPGSSNAVKAVVWCLAATSFLEDSSVPAAARARHSPRPSSRPRSSPASTDGGGLRLRDETPLEMRER